MAMAFAVRHLALIFLGYFPGMSGNGDTHFIFGVLTPALLLADLPALLLLVSWRFRLPGAARFWRRVWRHGRSILLATLCLQLVLLGDTRLGRALLEHPSGGGSTLVVAYALLQLYVMAYLLFSARVKAVFGAFPGALPEVTPASRIDSAATGPGRPPPRSSGDTRPHPNPFHDLTGAAADYATGRLRAATGRIRPNDPAEADRLAVLLARGTPESAEVWHELGLHAVRQEKLRDAAVLIERAMAVNPEHPLYPRNLCEIQRRLGQFDAALQAGHKAVQLAPNDADAHFNLALVFTQSNRPKAAIGSYEAAVRLRPAHAQAWNNLGVLYRQTKQPEAAVRAFERALAAEPGLTEAQANLREVRV